MTRFFPGGSVEMGILMGFSLRERFNPFAVAVSSALCILFLCSPVIAAEPSAESIVGSADNVTDRDRNGIVAAKQSDAEPAEDHEKPPGKTKEEKEKEKEEKEKALYYVPPPPPKFLYNKPRLPDYLLYHKREGFFITGFPIIGVDPDTGFNVGASLQLYWDKTRKDPFFAYTPYRHCLKVAAMGSPTTGYQLYNMNYDAPNFSDTPFGVHAVARFESNRIMNYYGIGGGSLEPLTDPVTGVTYDKLNDYWKSLQTIRNFEVNTRYNYFDYKRLQLDLDVSYELLGGILLPMVGLQVSYVFVDDYSGQQSLLTGPNGHSAVITEGPTRLSQDCADGTAIGCDGGWDNYLKLGITLDTRDFAPDPSNGVLFMVASEFSTKVFGSAYNYGRVTTNLSGYYNVLKHTEAKLPLVLAGRVMYNYQFWDVPVYSINTIARTDFDQVGLGGYHTIHGYPLDRFLAHNALLFNANIRWSFMQFEFWGQNLKWMAVPFFDAGAILDNDGASFGDMWRLAGGGGIHVAWNLATIIIFDLGFSSEEMTFNMDVGHQF